MTSQLYNFYILKWILYLPQTCNGSMKQNQTNFLKSSNYIQTKPKLACMKMETSFLNILQGKQRSGFLMKQFQSNRNSAASHKLELLEKG
ncbi:hypothetical protein FGO68_gene1600 [Halteria grandinella]|uniref:Uncharacterized protein n=1 Tax=Halteria grandinella TaxID=5974 RepID=A0A8J8T0I0_HALGN|nr:hypothetical protein FGO68_gene1600 [Halteria grandinella]